MTAGYEKWIRVHTLVNEGKMMTSNIVEYIDGKLIQDRELPILDFLDHAIYSLNLEI